MRIVWLSHFIPYPPKGGNLQRSHYLLKEAARRHEVHLVTLNQRANLATEEEQQAAIAALSPGLASIKTFPIPADSSRTRWSMLVASSFFRSRPYATSWMHSDGMLATL